QYISARWGRGRCRVTCQMSLKVRAIHAAFTPDAGEVRSARALVAAYEAQQRGDGDAGAPIGSPDYLSARRLLARHAEFQNWHLATPGLPPAPPVHS
ncbi:hypothetical protein LPZ50_02940, partial [Bordetella petrii]|nr:hypothetical protein [Bordetella petrii]